MIKVQTLSDTTAISLSLMCALHCLALPLALIVFPSIATLQLDNEYFHFWMIIIVIPISLYALTLGCKAHKRFYTLSIGVLGLALLLLAVSLTETVIKEIGEKILTLMGATFIAFSHYRNYKLCLNNTDCARPEGTKVKQTEGHL
ncbi:MerC domain-containing protein [Marinagarivorans cellulosilyticus]|uniref:MerC mercury resistance protein n=1 Tax=Marinagarivorans cellulosilyticus TaxID=2721545 RepID=A0AAN1WJF1_9GAMM|nr:MerC domain-containing protein [Marinagarivorans cellulosilyticus]BCD98751.1 hypothetical protein MARGE09_P2952 [Marinagarivorans cellulosilyticus]